MIRTALITLTMLLATAASASAVELRVDIDEHILDVVRDGEVVATYPISAGLDEHPTPTGQFKVKRMIWNPSWVPPDEKWARGKAPKGPKDPDNPMKVVKIFFKEPDYYIHGTGAVDKLGEKASHGCIRMAPEDARELGLLLMDAGGVAREESWIRRVLRLGRPRTVTLPQAVPVVIRE